MNRIIHSVNNSFRMRVRQFYRTWVHRQMMKIDAIPCHSSNFLITFMTKSVTLIIQSHSIIDRKMWPTYQTTTMTNSIQIRMRKSVWLEMITKVIKSNMILSWKIDGAPLKRPRHTIHKYILFLIKISINDLHFNQIFKRYWIQKPILSHFQFEYSPRLHRANFKWRLLKGSSWFDFLNHNITHNKFIL